MDQNIKEFIYGFFKKPINSKRGKLVYKKEIEENDEKIEISKDIGYQEVRDFLEEFEISKGFNFNRTIFLNSIYYLYFNKLMTVDQECDFIKFLNEKYYRGFPEFAMILYAKKMLQSESKKTVFEIIESILCEVLDVPSLNHFINKQDDLDTKVNAYFKELFDYIKRSFLNKDNLGYEQSDIEKIVYLYYAIAFNTQILDFDYYLDFERSYLEYYGHVNANKAKERIGKVIPGYLIKNSSNKSMSAFCYLYYGSMDKIASLESENREANEINSNLASNIQKKNDEISLLQNKITELNILLIEKDKSIEEYRTKNENLHKEIELQEGKNEYNKNILNQQLDTLEEDIKEDIESRISVELESIYDISTILDEKNAQRIQKRLEKINKVFK